MPYPTQGTDPWWTDLKEYLDRFELGTYASDARAALRAISLVSSNQQFAVITTVDDGTLTDNWPNRMEFWWDPADSVPRLTSFFNEYGELRIIPAKGSTVPLRLFQRENNTSAPTHNAGVALFEIMDNRTDRNVLFQIHNDGSIDTDGVVTAGNVEDKVVCWPTGSEPSFASQPDGTLWIEYTP